MSWSSIPYAIKAILGERKKRDEIRDKAIKNYGHSTTGDRTMTDEALKPCPFCGGEAKYYYYTPRDHNIECESCSNGTCLHETEAEAITAWNTRANADYVQLREDIRQYHRRQDNDRD